MAITMNGSGQINLELTNRTSFTSVPSYSFCSSVLTTTANYGDNQLEFGALVQEIHIVNLGNQPVAFQFKEFFGLSKDSGIVPEGDRITLRTAHKGGIAIRSADPTKHSSVVVFAV